MYIYIYIYINIYIYIHIYVYIYLIYIYIFIHIYIYIYIYNIYTYFISKSVHRNSKAHIFSSGKNRIKKKEDWCTQDELSAPKIEFDFEIHEYTCIKKVREGNFPLANRGKLGFASRDFYMYFIT